MKKHLPELRVSGERWSYSFLCVLSLSHSICVFARKLQLIQANQEELHGNLITVENCDSSESPSLSWPPVAECHDLCQCCVDMSYNRKLLMQSNLDMTFAKLDTYGKKLNEIYKTGNYLKNLWQLFYILWGNFNLQKLYFKLILKKIHVGLDRFGFVQT